jgi:O-antigen ligase
MAEVSTSIWDSRLLRRLDLFGAIVAVLVLGRLVWEEDISWLVAVAGGLLVLLLASVKWPYGAFVMLFAMSAASGFQFELFGLNAHPEHIAIGIVSIAFVIWVLLHKVNFKLDSLDYWILAYVFVTIFSSAFTSPAPASTLRWALQSFLAIVPYFFIRALVRDKTTLRNTFYILLAVGTAESLYGIASYLSYQLFGTTFGMTIGIYGDVSAPQGTMVEPNLFGAYAAACAVGFLALLSSGERMRRLALAGFLVTSVAMFLSFSRAAFLTFVIVAGWIFLRSKPSGNRGRVKKLVFVAVGSLLVVVVLGATSVGAIVKQRFTDLASSGLVEDDTAIVRSFSIFEALQDIPKHPIVGSGASSLQLTFDMSQYIPGWDRPIWIGNLAVRVLHDSGILGLVALTGFFISVWIKTRSGLRNQFGRSAILLGLWAGALLYCITFQATDGTILAFSWIHFGLLASAATLSPG